MQEIFTSASGDGNDALIVKPGVAGMLILLQSRLSEYLIVVEDIGGVFVALSLDADCFLLTSNSDLLQLYFPDHLITAEDIGGVFVALSLDAACSFTYIQFESFVNHLFFLEGRH